jgi:hypothetical protein
MSCGVLFAFAWFVPGSAAHACFAFAWFVPVRELDAGRRGLLIQVQALVEIEATNNNIRVLCEVGSE